MEFLYAKKNEIVSAGGKKDFYLWYILYKPHGNLQGINLEEGHKI